MRVYLIHEISGSNLSQKQIHSYGNRFYDLLSLFRRLGCFHLDITAA